MTLTRPFGTRPFGTVLVANRGEIALRVIRAAHGMGLRTVAVYSDADREASFVRAASTAVHIGPTPAKSSYLSVPAILEAAAQSGAEAIHPGYGFLSESATFAAAVRDAGLVFVGPTPEVIEKLGRKDSARLIAQAAGVPVVPSFEVTDDGSFSLAELEFPVLVKAAAGGGGKGMRVVRSADGFEQALGAAKREAASAFGDDTIVVEKYVELGRHVEVQVLADAHGNVVHLGERDCSTQRRHQKVIEEAPAPTISQELREQLTSGAVALTGSVGYLNAGTVEFLVDATTDEAYFLEMNTRLQVEHPVTEAVTGRDLVQLQLRVAMGEELPFGQDDVTFRGHAIEVRVYAEDAYAGFLPQAGRADLVRWSDRSRNDVALESGQEVSSSYDPMIGKVIVHGPDRESARSMLIAALDETAVVGLMTNIGYVRGLLASDAFRDAEIDTAWLDRNAELVPREGNAEASVFAAWGIADYELGARSGHPFGTADGWRLSGPSAPATISLSIDGTETLWSVSWRRVASAEQEFRTRLISREVDRLRLEIDDQICSATVQVGRRQVVVVYRGSTFVFGRPDPFAPRPAALAGGSITAPMPGTVLDVRVAAGDTVAEGDVLGAMEAMKMELSLKAPFAGTVIEVGAAVGDQVALGSTLFVVEADGGDS